MYILHFVYPFISIHIISMNRSIHLLMNDCLTIMNNAVMNMAIQISLPDAVFNYFGYIFRCGITESYGSSISKFLRNHHTLFHSVCTILHSHPSQRLLFSVFLVVAILMGMRWLGIFLST